MKAPADMASVQYTTPCRGVFSVHARTQAVHSSVGQAFCASFFEALLQKEGDGKWSRCRDSREEGRIGACWSKSGQPNIAHCVNLYFLERALHGSSSSLGLHLFLHIEKRKYLQCSTMWRIVAIVQSEALRQSRPYTYMMTERKASLESPRGNNSNRRTINQAS